MVDCSLAKAPDRVIERYAAKVGAVIVTKDEDFAVTRWSNRTVEDIAAELARIENEALAVGIRYPRLTPWLCARLADERADSLQAGRQLVQQRLPADLVEPFLRKVTATAAPGGTGHRTYPDAVATAGLGRGVRSWSGPESTMWTEWSERFKQLLDDDDTRLIRVGEIGVHMAHKHRERALERERQEDIHGN